MQLRYLDSMLGLEAAPYHRLTVQPVLPEWLADVQLTNIAVDDATVALRLWREGDRTKWDVMQHNGDVIVSAQN